MIRIKFKSQRNKLLFINHYNVLMFKNFQAKLRYANVLGIQFKTTIKQSRYKRWDNAIPTL